MIIGADIGRNNSKISTKYENTCIRTACKIEQSKGYGDKNYIYVDGTRYLVGQGNGIVNDNKAFDNTFKICLINSLAKIGGDNYKVVTGLPITHYKLYKDDIINEFKGTTFEIGTDSVDGIDKRLLTISDINVAPEGILCMADSTNDNLLVDIGGYTVDVAYFEEGKLVKADSYPLGMKVLYGNIAQELKRIGSDCDESKVQDYVRRSKYILNNKVEFFDHTPYRQQQLDLIIEKIRNDFPWHSTTKTFTGGGSVEYRDLLEKMNYRVKEDTIYDNAIAFRKFGEALWQEK